LLVTRGLAETRSRAGDLIRRGAMSVNGAAITKPGQSIAADTVLDMAEDAGRYVSRGAFKLVAALDSFKFDPAGRNALDVGASTGGFTQVLLERGAAHVTAADVGRGPSHREIRADPRVTTLENAHARALTQAVVPSPVTAIAVDVNFVSIAKVLPAVLKLAAPGSWLVSLVKPQFEAGRAAVGRTGIVRDQTVRLEAVRKVRNWLAARSGWRIAGIIDSPIAGGSGNKEYLIGTRFRG
jgi:23S rRNA (cytidine1920-2'-O)/16S rRNA (cytidine1409-2'-O)-methyltransferase